MLLTRDAEKRPSAEELLRRASFTISIGGQAGNLGALGFKTPCEEVLGPQKHT